ncbi:MAG: DUF1566 domain-containing protein [Elusimicrobiales bacterium]|jgi:hypothetical protein
MGFAKDHLIAAMLLVCAAVPAAADISTHSFANCGFPDAGQAVCYNATVQSACPVAGFPGQDAEYASSAAMLRYTIYVPVAGSSVTVDDLTGLIWASTGSSNGALVTWANAISSCENSTFGGYSDWRLPNIKELQSIVNYGTAGAPRITAAAFPSTASSAYWSSTICSDLTSDAFDVNFNLGEVYHAAVGTTAYVRCVRGGP